MSDEGQSAKRRRILSSINPELPQEPRPSRRASASASPTPTQQPRVTTKQQDEADKSEPRDAKDYNGEEDSTRPRPTRLRLKDEKRRRRRHHSRDRGGQEKDDDDGDRHRRHRHHHHHRRRKERSPTPPNPFEEPALDPDAAFRESLFDAMADDEGADYWESVYGQPVHIYTNERAGPDGELERMTEEEYAAHVRQKMWEKTHAGLLEERARREAARKARKQEDRRAERLRSEVEESLRRGEERRHKRRWADRWAAYEAAWSAWDGDPTGLPWPLDSGRREDIAEEPMRTFFVRGLDLEKVGEAAFMAKLKEERVRWHPDKIQQRLGGRVDENIMKDVTATFQIIDRLWSDTRGKS